MDMKREKETSREVGAHGMSKEDVQRQIDLEEAKRNRVLWIAEQMRAQMCSIERANRIAAAAMLLALLAVILSIAL